MVSSALPQSIVAVQPLAHLDRPMERASCMTSKLKVTIIQVKESLLATFCIRVITRSHLSTNIPKDRKLSFTTNRATHRWLFWNREFPTLSGFFSIVDWFLLPAELWFSQFEKRGIVKPVITIP